MTGLGTEARLLCGRLVLVARGQGRWLCWPARGVSPGRSQLQTQGMASWHTHLGFAKHHLPPLPYRCFKFHRERSVRPVFNQFN